MAVIFVLRAMILILIIQDLINLEFKSIRILIQRENVSREKKDGVELYLLDLMVNKSKFEDN